MFITKRKHEAVIIEHAAEWQKLVDAMVKTYDAALAARDAEIRALRNQLRTAENLLAEERGKAVAKAHAEAKPAPKRSK